MKGGWARQGANWQEQDGEEGSKRAVKEHVLDTGKLGAVAAALAAQLD